MLGVRGFVVVDWSELSFTDAAGTFHRPEPGPVFAAQGTVGVAGIGHRGPFCDWEGRGTKRNPPRWENRQGAGKKNARRREAVGERLFDGREEGEHFHLPEEKLPWGQVLDFIPVK